MIHGSARGSWYRRHDYSHINDSHHVEGKRGMFLYSTVSSRPTLNPLADLFIPAPIRLLWEAFSHAAITARRLFTHISTTVQVLIYTAESTGASWTERKCPDFETVAEGTSNAGSLDCGPDILPLSDRVPPWVVVAQRQANPTMVLQLGENNNYASV